jgi:hypothetical protein
MASLSTVQILSQIQSLPEDEQRDLIEQLNALVSTWDDEPRPRITDLEGLGEEIWQGIDAQDYVNQERDSWDG